MRHRAEGENTLSASSGSGASDDEVATQILEPPPQKKGRGGARSQLWNPRQTEVLLQQIKHHFTRLTGKTERRSKVFADIAQLMQEVFPGVTSAHVKTKWRNLKQQFIKYKTERTSTGRSRHAAPQRIDLLEQIMGNRDIVNPRTMLIGFPTPASVAGVPTRPSTQVEDPTRPSTSRHVEDPPRPSTSRQRSHTPDPEVRQETRRPAPPSCQTGWQASPTAELCFYLSHLFSLWQPYESFRYINQSTHTFLDTLPRFINHVTMLNLYIKYLILFPRVSPIDPIIRITEFSDDRICQWASPWEETKRSTRNQKPALSEKNPRFPEIPPTNGTVRTVNRKTKILQFKNLT
ncbi:hypothetical protein GWK47_053964 [Chionoecetes opilio]|uniref:Myb/SANT-like DNA-binding domain-containing protein n=1 Tax=Chionoecetes opilio TaxID=41210 RepID=A0A8J4XZ62_CHIOP|nr:hypothetical protein GWK47_053964 [Chionoecetes opilio]